MNNTFIRLACLSLVACMSLLSAKAAPPKTYVRIKTSLGESIVLLYDQTPKHKLNFTKLARKGMLNNTLFHRVIKEFMIQGGDPDSKKARPGQVLGEGDLGYRVPAEFNPALFHKKGALAAARDDNPQKASSASQFYIVHGRTYTDAELDRVEEVKFKGRKIPAAQRIVYKTLGGSPFLDMNYTVFGEVVRGMEMVDAIAALEVDENNRPLKDVAMRLTVLKRGEARRLEKALQKELFDSRKIM